jgi:hypothetical protein
MKNPKARMAEKRLSSKQYDQIVERVKQLEAEVKQLEAEAFHATKKKGPNYTKPKKGKKPK